MSLVNETCFAWPWGNSTENPSCNVVPQFTRRGVQDIFGGFYLTLQIFLAACTAWYLFLCALRFCQEARGHKATPLCGTRNIICGCTRPSRSCCLSSARSPGWEAVAVIIVFIKICGLAIVYYAPLWNGSYGCGLWNWELLNILVYLFKALFFLSLTLWMCFDMRGLLPAGADKEATVSSSTSLIRRKRRKPQLLSRKERKHVVDLRKWACLCSLGLGLALVLTVALFVFGYKTNACESDFNNEKPFAAFSFNDPCQFLVLAQIFIKAIAALSLSGLGHKCVEEPALRHWLQPLSMSILVFGLAEWVWVAADIVYFGLDLEWPYEMEVALHVLLVTSPMLQFIMRTLFKCAAPAIVAQGVKSREERACGCDRHRTRQCCVSLQYSVPFLIIVTFFSAALATVTGLATCVEEVFIWDHALSNNFTPAERLFGVGFFWARLGVGPLGFLTFLTSVCVYFGIVTSLQKTVVDLVPRVLGSPITVHSVLAILLNTLVGFHIYGQWAAKVAFNEMSATEREHLSEKFFNFFTSFENNWPLPIAYWTGIIATACLVVLTIGGLMSVARGGIFPWCYLRLCACSCCKCCGIYEPVFRGIHRLSALVLPISLFFHGVEQTLGAWTLWMWMTVLLAFFLFEYAGFQGWCACFPCMDACRPQTLKLCGMRQDAKVLAVEPETKLKKLKDGSTKHVVKSPLFVALKCAEAFEPQLGEYCFLGIGEGSKSSQSMSGFSFHPFTPFPLAKKHEWGFYFTTGLDEKTLNVHPTRGGWSFKHFGEGVVGPGFDTVEACYEAARRQLDNKTVVVVGGFASELAKDSFIMNTHIFCTSAGAGVTPFVALAAAVYKDPRRFGGKVITVVRSAKHERIPNVLKELFGFQETVLMKDTDKDDGKDKGKDVVGSINGDNRSGSQSPLRHTSARSIRFQKDTPSGSASISTSLGSKTGGGPGQHETKSEDDVVDLDDFQIDVAVEGGRGTPFSSIGHQNRSKTSSTHSEWSCRTSMDNNFVPEHVAWRVCHDVAASVGGMRYLTLPTKFVQFRFLQGYINISSVLESATRAQEDATRTLLQSRFRGEPQAFDSWVSGLPRPLLHLDVEALESMFDGWMNINAPAVLASIHRVQESQAKKVLNQVFLDAGVSARLDALRRAPPSLNAEVLATIFADEVPADVVEVLENVRSAQEREVVRVLQQACKGDTGEWHPLRGLRPLLCLTEEFFANSFNRPDNLMSAISTERVKAVKRVLSGVYVGHVDFESWYRVQALGETPNVYKLDEVARDCLCPIVKLANTFATADAAMGATVSFGHCGNADKIDFDSSAFQEHVMRNGEAFVETF